jgi:hypothetical protein
MPLSAAQRTIAQSRTRFRVAICGRRFGKTHLAIRELCKEAAQPRREVWFVAPTYRQAKQIVWRKLKYKLQDLNWCERVNESELSIDLKNGSRISLKGADNADSLRGVGLDFLVMDEFADINPEAFYEVLRPTLADKQGKALFIGTPRGMSNWSYDLYRMPEQDNTNWSSFQFTTVQGGNVNQEEIEEARKLLDARTFQQEFEATFITAGNRVWYAFDRLKNVQPWSGDVPSAIEIGCDFNLNPISAVVFARKGDHVWAIDEIEIYGSNTQELVEEIRTRYNKHRAERITVYPDPAGSAGSTKAATGVTDHSILRNAGFTVKAPRAHNPIKDGVNAVNSMLCNSVGQQRFFIDPKCKRLIECLERHNYKPGTSQPDKDTGYDHLTDAARYYFDYVWPVRRNIVPEPPQRWGHAIGATQ